jgi:hypothetical protein
LQILHSHRHWQNPSPLQQSVENEPLDQSSIPQLSNPYISRIQSVPLTESNETTELTDILCETLSKHGFAGIDNPEKLNLLLENISYENYLYGEYKYYYYIKQYLSKYVAKYEVLENDRSNTKIKIKRFRLDESIEEIDIIYKNYPFAEGVSNSIHRGKIGNKNIIVKKCKDTEQLINNFNELFIHAILSIYQHRFLQQKQALLITPLIIISYNESTQTFITILEPISGDINSLIEQVSEADIKKIIYNTIFYQSCGLLPLQNDLEFIHGDNHTGNMFYSNINGKIKYYFADFGYSRIKINDFLLSAAPKNYLLKKYVEYYNNRKDLMQFTDSVLSYIDKMLNEDEINTLKLKEIKKNIEKNKSYPFYTKRLFTGEGLYNLGNENYSIYEPLNMINYLSELLNIDSSYCKEMIGEKFKSYIPSMQGGNYYNKYIKYKNKYKTLLNETKYNYIR